MAMLELRDRTIHAKAGSQEKEMRWSEFCFVITGASARSLNAVALNRLELFGRFSFVHANNGVEYTLTALKGWEITRDRLLLALDGLGGRIYSDTTMKQNKFRASLVGTPQFGLAEELSDEELSRATIQVGDVKYVEHLKNNDFAIMMDISGKAPVRWLASTLKPAG